MLVRHTRLCIVSSKERYNLCSSIQKLVVDQKPGLIERLYEWPCISLIIITRQFCLSIFFVLVSNAQNTNNIVIKYFQIDKFA